MKIKTLFYSLILATTLSVPNISTAMAQPQAASPTPVETQGEVRCSVGSAGWKCEIVVRF